MVPFPKLFRLNPIKQDGSKSLALGLEKLELLEELILCIP